MKDMIEFIKQPEGRRLEFKEKLPSSSDLAKTIIAFANDAGGDIYIGIKDAPREIIGINENDLIKTEEQISNIIYAQCAPLILPSITFLSIDGKQIIKVSVYPGNTPPYYAKHKGIAEGVYIRVGSSNRVADSGIIQSLERKRNGVSYDGEPAFLIDFEKLNIDSFKKLFLEKTGETVNNQTLKKLELIKKQDGKLYPTRAMILLSDSEEPRRASFAYSKIECARFKGTSVEEFIDQKTISGNIALQAEEAYNFALRHINKGAQVKGVYTIPNWEYPVNAVREAIRNAVAHRDYSLTGKDIKIAIYDDMIEITSPGLLPASIDYSQMEIRQSDARNKIIALVFKKLGIIDQWGNGLKLISDELKLYPNIEFKWRETGLSFQVQFIKKQPVPIAARFQKTAQKTAQKIILEIQANPYVTRLELSEKFSMTPDKIKHLLNALKKQGKIRRIGADNGGYWEVLQ
jgi:predicted HTH transcriptional regulator